MLCLQTQQSNNNNNKKKTKKKKKEYLRIKKKEWLPMITPHFKNLPRYGNEERERERKQEERRRVESWSWRVGFILVIFLLIILFDRIRWKKIDFLTEQRYLEKQVFLPFFLSYFLASLTSLYSFSLFSFLDYVVTEKIHGANFCVIIKNNAGFY